MKSIILLLIVVCTYDTVQAQFKRTFLNGYEGINTFGTFAIDRGSNGFEVLHVNSINSSDIAIRTSTIDQLGNLNSETYFTFNVSEQSNEKFFISGVYDQDPTTRTLVMIIYKPASQRLMYLQYNPITGAVINRFVTTETYKIGFIKSISNGPEIVNYLVKSTGGLHRIAINPSNFMMNEESVDASLSLGSTASFTIFGAEWAIALIYNNKEYLFVGKNSTSKTIYTRDAMNIFSTTLLSSTNDGLIQFFIKSNGNLFVADGTEYFELNSNLSPIITGSLESFSSSPKNIRTFEMNNKTYRFANVLGSQTVFIQEFNSSMTFINERMYEQQFTIFGDISSSNGHLLVGFCNQDPIEYSQNGAVISNTQKPFLHFSTDFYDLESSTEFFQTITSQDLKLNLGLGYRTVEPDYSGLSGMDYINGQSLVYTLTHNFVGYTAQGDTLGTNANAFLSDILAGPYTTPNLYSHVTESQYNKSYFVTKDMIVQHLAAIQSGSPNYIAPFGIRNWPAHGDVALGQASNLAPFIDVNSNGLYEPYSGDYPSIFGSRCVFSIAHQNPAIPKSSGIEVHAFWFDFGCDTSLAFENAFFQKLFFISRVHDFDSLVLGTFMDGDVGNFSDDYIGTDVSLGLIYNFNGDNNDESNGSQNGFGNNPPAQGLIILKGAKQASDGVDNGIGILEGESVNGLGFNDGIVDNEYLTLESSITFNGGGTIGTSDPTNIIEWENYLSNRWFFGDTHVFGGNGFPGEQNSTTIPSKYQFPDNSDPLHYGTNGVDPGFNWSEITPDNVGGSSLFSGDRRIIASTSKQRLYLGDTLEYVFGYVLGYDSTLQQTSLFDSRDYLVNICSEIKSKFAIDEGGCGYDFGTISPSLGMKEEDKSTISVYPNPTKNEISVLGILNKSASLKLFDLSGRELLNSLISAESNSLSLDSYEGNVFILLIQDGNVFTQKRIIKID